MSVARTVPAPDIVTELQSVREDWQRLATASENVFSTWEWAEAWHRHIAPRAALRIVRLRRSPDEAPFALLPLCIVRNRPLRVIRLAGSGPADELGPICSGPDRSSASRLTGTHARDLLRGAGVFLGERLWGEHDWAREMDATTVTRASSPTLNIAGTSFEQFLASRSRNFRSQLGRFSRALARDHRVVYRLTQDPAQLEADMANLMRLHETRWGSRSAAFAGARRRFHLDFAHAALERGWLRLWTMDLDGVPVAAWYGFRFGQIETYYQSGRLPELDRLHIGTILLSHTIRCACEDRMGAYRFGLGPEPYKRRFTDEDPGLATVALGAGVSGRIGLQAMQAYPRLPASVRRRVRP